VDPQADGSFVMSTNQTITPAGTLVNLGTPTRGKAIALNPNPTSHTAAVLQMGASASLQIFDLVTGQVLQSFSPNGGRGHKEREGSISPQRHTEHRGQNLRASFFSFLLFLCVSVVKYSFW
jgi:hypothetical protein